MSMRSDIVGVVLAALFLAGLFAMDRYYPHPDPAGAMDAAAAKVVPGFVGEERIGAWDLICEKAPPQADGAVVLGRCRVNFQFRPKAHPEKVLMGMNFRLVGPSQRLTLLLRVPPLVHKDDQLVVGFGRGALKVPVMNCEQNQCLAGGGLDEAALTRLFAGGRGAVVFPANASGKRQSLPFPLLGIKKSVEALRRAESAPAG
jgi:invasion protein IalB